METSLIQIIVAAAMLIVVVLLFLGLRSYQLRGSERRMSAMLESVGLDPAIATSGDMKTIMGEVRQRCRHCQSEGLCERWLKGEETGDNAFCPNAKVFEVLKKYSSPAG